MQAFGHGAVRLIAERLRNFLLRFAFFTHDENRTVILRQRGKESVSQFRIGVFCALGGKKGIVVYSYVQDSDIKKYYVALLLLGTISRIARELQIHTKGMCQISNSAFVIVSVPTPTNYTINFTETCKHRILV